jgi:hypothetical protein
MHTSDIEKIEDNVSATELKDFFRYCWKKILLGSLLAAALGTSISLLSGSTYLAIAHIQMAKVRDNTVEEPSILMDKLKIPNYYSSASIMACGVIDGTSLAKKLNFKLEKSGQIISIMHKQKLAGRAKKCLESIFNDIRSNQKKIAEPRLKIQMNELSYTKKSLDLAQNSLSKLSSRENFFNLSDSQFNAATLKLSIALSKEKEVIELASRIVDLESALEDPRTKDTSLLAEIYSPNTPEGPTEILVAVGSALGGAILTIGLLLNRRGWRQPSRANAVDHAA